MRVANIIPPQWESVLGRGQYRMTYVPWVLQDLLYREMLRATSEFLMLDHGLFEDDLKVPNPWLIYLVTRMLDPDEVVLPDVLGNSVATIEAACSYLQQMSPKMKVMVVPQARTMKEWGSCLECILITASLRGFDRPTIGLSSLRRTEGLRAQVGTRIPMMKYLHDRGLEMHLLGLCSVRHFVEEELPIALELGVRGLDTCAAFALGVRGLELTKDSPRLFLGDLTKYSRLTHTQLSLIRCNMQTLENWLKGE